MSRYAAFVLFLAIGLRFSCAADFTFSDNPDTSAPSEAPITDTTTTPTTTVIESTTATETTTTTATETTTTTATETTTTTTKETPTTTTNSTTTTSTETTTTTTEAPTSTSSAPNTTSSAPNTTSTAPITTTPTPTSTPPPLPTPEKHLYQVKQNNATCLMIQFGLRIGYQGDKYEEMNFQFTNGTNVTGSCRDDISEMMIQAETLAIKLSFKNDTMKFSLHALNVTGKTSSGVAFSQANNNLSYWEASLGSSYMCNKEQNYTITDQLTIFTFDLQVQPFGVKKDSFSTAQECSMDDTSILIPIVVGAALAGLILIVVIAYVIGRRKTYVGYQTL